MKKFIVIFLSLLVLLSLWKGTESEIFASITAIDSLESLLDTTKEDIPKTKILNRLCWEYRNVDPEKAIKNGNSALELAAKINFKKGMANAYDKLGLVYSSQSDYDKALKSHNKALEIRKQMGDQHNIAIILNNIALIYLAKGDLKKALDLHLRALTTFENENDKKNMAMAYLNIGNVYSYQQNIDKALEYYLKTLNIYKKEIDYKPGLATCLNNIAASYYKQGKFELTLDCFRQSLKIHEKMNNKAGVALCLSNIGSLSIELGKYNKANEYLQRSLEINKELGLKDDIAVNLHNLGNLSIKLKRYKMAETYFLNSLKLCEQTGYIHLKQANYKSMAENYAEEGRYKNAYRSIQLYHQVKDSLFNDKSSKQLAEIQQKYENEKKERALQMKQAQFKRKNDLQNLIIFAGVLIFFVIVILAGKYNLSPNIVKILLLMTLLVLFEFVMILIDPLVSEYTGGLPLPTLTINGVLALIFALINRLMEKRIKNRLIK